MALEKTFEDLYERLLALEKVLEDFANAVLHGKPADEDHHLADRLWDAVAEMQGRSKDAKDAAADARKAVELPINLELAWRKLKACQQSLNQLSRQFPTEVASDKHVEELIRVADLMTLRSEHPEWAGWVNVQLVHLGETREKILDATDGALLCWEEIAERAGMTNVSMHATNIGQQITVPVAKESTREAIPETQ